jgi:hypothetical protein
MTPSFFFWCNNSNKKDVTLEPGPQAHPTLISETSLLVRPELCAEYITGTHGIGYITRGKVKAQ